MRRLKHSVEKIRAIYEIGVPVETIARNVGARPDQVKRIVRREGLRRVPARYAEGVSFLAYPGESFRQTSAPGYWVSDLGRVISMRDKPGTVLKQQMDVDGYLRVHLYQESRSFHVGVHRLVALAFLGPAGEGEAVAHNNGRRTDNRLSNLRWATQADNVADKADHGTAQIGSKHPRSKATEEGIAKVKAAFRAGASIQSAANAGRVSFHIAADVNRGKTWRHVQ